MHPNSSAASVNTTELLNASMLLQMPSSLTIHNSKNFVVASLVGPKIGVAESQKSNPPLKVKGDTKKKPKVA